MTEETITIPLSEYNELKNRDAILSALESGGVEDWEWYYDSLRDAGLIDNDDEDEE